MKQYQPKLDYFKTQKAIKFAKDTFERKLAEKLSLIRVSAPRFLHVSKEVDKGLQDDLAGTQMPVSFSTKFSDCVEIVHSLAKWKRFTLGKYGFTVGTGLYTDMDAIRKDEDVSEIHSIYVDQWDWEKVISKDQRRIDFLKYKVELIYEALLETEQLVQEKFGLTKRLPPKISFVTTQKLEDRFPSLTPKEREHAISQELGAVFLIGIGHELKSGKIHDLRAADYDDWKLCGDIVVWDDIRKKSLELSSMGIRVDSESLRKQLKFLGLESREQLEFHQGIIEDTIPLSIGGGIGQSRICMFLLHKAHIGEVQASVWPEEFVQQCKTCKIELL
ncbi:aspartate--ammonia ligase [archaeon]|jgi:aspartate--ammonia ligase|nr:aspartate--ammonia ligase [archaeon]MBT3451548.1 aspartate--ammonia ligase [archaeon]MBT6869407.1 aspartate--ammonia ligase [archaeon]MBT7192570.1 aspartate--ammonia ligase [archaeon]MBT7380646.1 aspartate--ammonia ligase [archaeon]